MKRRDFIELGVIATAGALIFPAFTGCAAPTATYRREGNKIHVPLSEFASTSDAQGAKYVIVRDEVSKTSIIVNQTGPNAFVALSMVCTHKGCEVTPAGGQLVCPCHGSVFTSRDGDVVKGPAERPLRQYSTSIVGSDVVVDLT
jgi:Rieske Fe-S protein